MDWLGTARDHLFLKDAPNPSGVGSTWTSADGIQWHKTDLAEHVRPAAITEFNGMLIIAASHYNGTNSETSFWVSDVP